MIMEQAKVTSKGQITIPKKIREKLNINPGDKVKFITDESDGVKIITQKKPIEELKGILHRPDQKSRTIHEMNEGITEYLKEKYSK
jgi:AbrB family looped-hinge helix DNA binding protein